MTLVERLRAEWRKPDHKPTEMEEAAGVIEYLRDRIEQLEAENAALREDAERLDWLLGNPDATVCNGGPYGPFHIWFQYSNRTTEEKQTARAAINAAMGKP